MLNLIWLGLIILSVIFGAINGRLPQVFSSITDSTKLAFHVALGLTGMVVFWLGLMKIAEEAGAIKFIARCLRPALRRLFSDVPDDHPAHGAITMNIAANMLGVANAATPFGLRAMNLLEKLNPLPGTATNAMCTFLAINTSSVQLIPTTAIVLLATAGCKQPALVIATALIATTCSTLAGVISVKLLEKWPKRAPISEGEPS